MCFVKSFYLRPITDGESMQVLFMEVDKSAKMNNSQSTVSSSAASENLGKKERKKSYEGPIVVVSPPENIEMTNVNAEAVDDANTHSDFKAETNQINTEKKTMPLLKFPTIKFVKKRMRTFLGP